MEIYFLYSETGKLMDRGLWLVSLFLLPQLMAKLEGRKVKEREREGQGEGKGGIKMGREEIKLVFYREPISASQNYLFTGAELLANHFARL